MPPLMQEARQYAAALATGGAAPESFAASDALLGSRPQSASFTPVIRADGSFIPEVLFPPVEFKFVKEEGDVDRGDRPFESFDELPPPPLPQTPPQAAAGLEGAENTQEMQAQLAELTNGQEDLAQQVRHLKMQATTNAEHLENLKREAAAWTSAPSRSAPPRSAPPTRVVPPLESVPPWKPEGQQVHARNQKSTQAAEEGSRVYENMGFNFGSGQAYVDMLQGHASRAYETVAAPIYRTLGGSAETGSAPANQRQPPPSAGGGSGSGFIDWFSCSKVYKPGSS